MMWPIMEIKAMLAKTGVYLRFAQDRHLQANSLVPRVKPK